MTDRIGIALRRVGADPADIYLDDSGSLAVVYDAEAVAQHARQRLMAYYGEWFLDKTVGVQWFRDVLGKKYDAVLAESVIKSEILGTDGVESIESFSIKFDRELRGIAAYSIEVLTDYDELETL